MQFRRDKQTIEHFIKQALAIPSDLENRKMGQKTGSFSRIENKEQGRDN